MLGFFLRVCFQKKSFHVHFPVVYNHRLRTLEALPAISQCKDKTKLGQRAGLCSSDLAC